MTSHLAIFIIVALFIADYVGIVVWLMRTTTDAPKQTIRYSMRILMLGMTLVAIHLGAFAAFLSNTRK